MKKACLVLTFTGILVAALLAASTEAAAQTAAPMVDRWDAAVVTSLLTALGAHDIKDASISSQPGLLARTGDGLSMGLYAKACATAVAPATPVCQGIEGIVSYDPGDAADHSLLVDRLNHDFAAGKFMVERDGSIRLTRYVDLEGGVTQANLKAELTDFLAVASGAKQTVWATPAH